MVHHLASVSTVTSLLSDLDSPASLSEDLVMTLHPTR